MNESYPGFNATRLPETVAFEHHRSGFGGLSRKLFAGGGTDGAHVDVVFTRSQARQQTVGAAGHGNQRLGIPHHAESNFGGLSLRSWRVTPKHTQV